MEQRSLGLELEFLGSKVSGFSRHNRIASFGLSNDASIQTKIEVSNGKRPQRLTLGTEVNTNVFYDIYMLEQAVNAIFSELSSYGGYSDNIRNSLHVHVGLRTHEKDSVRFLKILLGLTRRFEFDLLTIGGLFHINRGVHNDFIYQRPLSMPLVVPTKFRDSTPAFVKAFNIDYILNKKFKRSQDLFAWYGDTRRIPLRYNAGRYVLINPISILVRGTVEFRFWNMPNVPELVMFAVDFSNAFVELVGSYYGNKKLRTYKILERSFPKTFGELLEELPFHYKNSLKLFLDIYNTSALRIVPDMIRDPMILHRYARGFFDGEYFGNLDKNVVEKAGMIIPPSTKIYTPKQTDFREYSYSFTI